MTTKAMTAKEMCEIKETLESRVDDENVIYVSECFFAEKINDGCTHLHLFDRIYGVDHIYDLVEYKKTYQDFPTFKEFIDEICEVANRRRWS